MSAHQFRAALEAGDAMAMWRVMAGAVPDAPQPKTPAQAEIILHRVRVETQSLALRLRAYSHAWLTERGLPSGLPDALKPAAERLYPRVVDAVGIAVKVPRIFAPVGAEIQRAMAEAVLELEADGVALDDRPVVHGRMFEARARTLKTLLGTASLAGLG